MAIERVIRPNRLKRNVFRSIGVSVLAALLLELALRIVLGLGSPVLYVTDPRAGYFLQVNQHLHRFFKDIQTNRFGMRSADVTDAKESGEYRILIVGDSVAFGTTYVDQRDIFPSLVQGRLSNAPLKITVLNGSAPGWAPSNELGFIASQGIHDADMVVMAYNTKDLDQPFAPFVESPLTPTRRPMTAIGELWTRYLRPRLFKTPPLSDPGSTASEGPPTPESFDSVLKTIAETRQLVKSNGAQFVILYTPAVVADVTTQQDIWRAALARLKEWANRESVPVIDMTAAFSAHQSKDVYFDGIHLRPLGDTIVANEMDAFIRAHLPPK